MRQKHQVRERRIYKVCWNIEDTEEILYSHLGLWESEYARK